jgi:pimeloyl-ACP methyl ester carboxylesterase
VTTGGYVLIHGGATTGRFWDRLLPLLDRPALAVDLPGRGVHPADLDTVTVDDEARSVVADVLAAGLPTPLTVVAHSSGGLPVPGVVAALGDRVAGVVLDAASVPPEGGCGIDCMQARHAERLLAARAAGYLRTPGPPADPEAFRTTYGGPPLDDETLAHVVAPERCVVDGTNHYFQPVHWSAASGVPVTYVVNTLDRPVPPALQHEMLARLPDAPQVVELDSGHVPAITSPAAFAAILASAPVR